MTPIIEIWGILVLMENPPLEDATATALQAAYSVLK